MLQRETLIRHLGQALSERDKANRELWRAMAINGARDELKTVRQWLRDVLDGKATMHVKTILEQVEKALGE